MNEMRAKDGILQRVQAQSSAISASSVRMSPAGVTEYQTTEAERSMERERLSMKIPRISLLLILQLALAAALFAQDKDDKPKSSTETSKAQGERHEFVIPNF